MATDLNFKTLVSTPTGVGASTGRQTEVAFNENFDKVKDNFQTIYGIISSSVLSEDLTMLKIDKTSSPWIVYYTSDPVDTPEQQVTWYPINRTTFASLLGNAYDNASLTTALNAKADLTDLNALGVTVSNATQSIADNTAAIADNTRAIGVNSTAITGINTELLSVVHTIPGNTLYMRYDSINNLVYISTDGTTWIDISSLNTTWASITGTITDNTALVNYVAGEITAASANYTPVAHVSNYSNPHNVTKAQVGLGNVDNTSDLNKPVSTATQAALDTKATVICMTATDYQTEEPETNEVFFTSSHFEEDEEEPEA